MVNIKDSDEQKVLKTAFNFQSMGHSMKMHFMLVLTRIFTKTCTAPPCYFNGKKILKEKADFSRGLFVNGAHYTLLK